MDRTTRHRESDHALRSSGADDRDPGRTTAVDLLQRSPATSLEPPAITGAPPWASTVPAIDDGAAVDLGLVPFDPAAVAPAPAFVARAASGGGVDGGADAAVARAQGGAGAPLPAEARGEFAQSLGADLGGVRVHTGGDAAAAAASVGARAFTIGQDIYFGDGEYDPDSAGGKLLLAHEVVHTVQQAGGAGTGERQHQLEVSEPGDALEQEAERVAPDVVAGRPVAVTGGGGAPVISRWATEPAEAVQARVYLQGAIQSARSAEEIAGVIAALEAPNSSEGLVTVQLPDDAPVSIVDLDLPPLLDEARARQRALGGEAGAPGRAAPGDEPEVDTAAGAAEVRAAIHDADTVEALDAILQALTEATYDRAGDEVPVALASGGASRVAWVERGEVATLRAEAEYRRPELAAQAEAEAQDDATRRAYEAEQADAQAREDDHHRQLDEQQAAEAADREARGLAVVRAAIEAHADSRTREQIRDALRAATDDGHGVFRPELPGGGRPELNAADRRQAITLAEQAVTEARDAERERGECRAPEGDASDLTPEQRADLIRQTGDAIVECGGAFDSAAQSMADQLRSAASRERDVAKLMFKIMFTASNLLDVAPPLKAVVAAVGAIGEYAAGEAAAAVSGAHDQLSFLTALQDAQRRGRDAISRDLNCHTVEELRAIRDSYRAIIQQGQAYYATRLRALVYNFDHQVAPVGTRSTDGHTSGTTGLAWVVRGSDAYLAVVHHSIDTSGILQTDIFQSWVFRSMARMALARDERVDELTMEDLQRYGGSVPPPPPYAYRRGDPLPEDRGAPEVR